MQIIKYLKLPFLFDAGLLRQEVNALSAPVWLPHYQVKHYEGEWSAIPLRSINGNANDIIIAPGSNPDYQDTVFLQNSPYLQRVLKSFHCPLQAVRLLKLNAGSHIKEHRDLELNFESGEIRLHIPVITHSDVEFLLDEERLTLQEGECWYMNFNLPHSIHNRSHINRIHLVIDALVNDWVKAIFADTAVTVKKEIENPLIKNTEAIKKQIIRQLRRMDTDTSNKLADELENN